MVRAGLSRAGNCLRQMSAPDADTLELASQLLSFSPARLEWQNRKSRVRDTEAQSPFGQGQVTAATTSTTPVHLVDTKTFHLARSGRQV